MEEILEYFDFQWGDYDYYGNPITSNYRVKTDFKTFKGNYEDLNVLLTFDSNNIPSVFKSTSYATVLSIYFKDSSNNVRSHGYTNSDNKFTKIDNEDGSVSFKISSSLDITGDFKNYATVDTVSVASYYAIVIYLEKDFDINCIKNVKITSSCKLDLKNGKVLAVYAPDIPMNTFYKPIPDISWRIDGMYNHGYPYIKRFRDIPYELIIPEYEAINLMDMIRVVSEPHGVDDLFPVTKMTIPLDKPEETKYTLGYSTSKSLVQSSNNTNSELFEKLKETPKPSSILISAKSNAASLITQALNGYVTLHQAEGGGCDEIIISSETDYTKAQNVWRWNLGGLGFSNQGYNAPAEAWQAAITMDGAIVANLITAGTMFADRIRGGNLILGAYDEVDGVLRVMRHDSREIVRMDKNGAYIEGRTISKNEDSGFTMVLDNGHIYSYSQYEEGRSDNDDHMVGYIHMTNGVSGTDKMSIGIVANDGIMLNCQWLGMSDKKGITYVMPEGLQSVNIVTNISYDSEGKVTNVDTEKLWFYNGIYAGTGNNKPFNT